MTKSKPKFFWSLWLIGATWTIGCWVYFLWFLDDDPLALGAAYLLYASYVPIMTLFVKITNSLWQKRVPDIYSKSLIKTLIFFSPIILFFIFVRT